MTTNNIVFDYEAYFVMATLDNSQNRKRMAPVKKKLNRKTKTLTVISDQDCKYPSRVRVFGTKAIADPQFSFDCTENGCEFLCQQRFPYVT